MSSVSLLIVLFIDQIKCDVVMLIRWRVWWCIYLYDNACERWR